jgi:hypothetical protein
MLPQDLKLGSVSAPAQRWALLLAVLLTLAPRALEVGSVAPRGALDSGAARTAGEELDLLQVLSSKSVVWGAEPLVQLVHGLDRTLGGGGQIWLAVQLVASVWIALVLLRRFARWLDYPSSATASVLWALMAFAVGAVLRPGGTILLALAQLLFVDALLDFARRRDAGRAWKLGLRLGLLSWLGGLGALWLLASIAWLPTMSHRFRGWAGVRLSATVMLVWAVSLSPVLVRNLVVRGEVGLPFSHVPNALVVAAGNEKLQPTPVAEESGIAGAEPAGAARPLFQGDGLVWRRAARRAVAFVGGWSPSMPATEFPLLRWDLLVVLSWLGTVALIPSWRAFLPLYLGLGLPLVQGAFTGLGPAALGAAAPFVALFAGYGIQRWWGGKTWPATWLLAPVVLLAAYLVRSWVEGWV